MSQRRLDQRQRQNVDKRRQKDRQSSQGLARVITHFGRKCLIENSAGEPVLCHLRQNIGKPVAGDWVHWDWDKQAEKKRQSHAGTTTTEQNKPDQPNHLPLGVILDIEPPKTDLVRQGFRGQGKRIAANVEQLLIVTALEPGIHPDVIDRYIAFADWHHIEPVIVINKMDLLTDATYEWVAHLGQTYQKLGIVVILVSKLDDTSLKNLATATAHKTSVFVGESGVGKSSLINGLNPSLNLKEGALSDYSGLGAHTTTHSSFYHLPGGGGLIDSPGIRELIPNNITLDNITQAYREFGQYACKYPGCSHTHEPECGVKSAVEQEDIAYSRYESYQRWYAQLESGLSE